MTHQRYQNIRTGCDWKHKAQIRPAKQSQVGEHPDYEDQDAGNCRRICESAQVVCGGQRHDTSDLVHSTAQESVPQHVGDDYQRNQDLSLSAMNVSVRIHAGFCGNKI